ncbi:MAG: hypothetical protein JEY71_04815 [Sphaerochaeta sp.]|nr:hypothetical protein [Sphaerochaeta sp.]
MTEAASESECLEGKYYRADGKVWRISTVLIRHDGVFLFLQRDEGKRIIMREVLLERTRIIKGDVDEEGSGSQTGTKDISCEKAMCKGTADGNMEDRQDGGTSSAGEVGSRDVGTRVGKGER